MLSGWTTLYQNIFAHATSVRVPETSIECEEQIGLIPPPNYKD